MLFLVATHVLAFLIGAIVIYTLCSAADDKRKAPRFVSKPIAHEKRRRMTIEKPP